MRETVLVLVAFFGLGAGFAFSVGHLMRSRYERLIAICVERDISPEKCVAIGDAVYGRF